MRGVVVVVGSLSTLGPAARPAHLPPALLQLLLQRAGPPRLLQAGCLGGPDLLRRCLEGPAQASSACCVLCLHVLPGRQAGRRLPRLLLQPALEAADLRCAACQPGRPTPAWAARGGSAPLQCWARLGRVVPRVLLGLGLLTLVGRLEGLQLCAQLQRLLLGAREPVLELGNLRQRRRVGGRACATCFSGDGQRARPDRTAAPCPAAGTPWSAGRRRPLRPPRPPPSA